MHQIKPQPELEPACLNIYRAKHADWDELTQNAEHKSEVKGLLLKRQSCLCAYCEKNISKDNSHIDHIIRRSEESRLTYEWQNLVCSCNSENTCGKGKEHKIPSRQEKVKGKDLIHPINDNARELIRFNAYSYQAVCHQSLSESNKTKCNESIEAYGLNDISLINMRKRAISNIVEPSIEEVASMADMPDFYRELRNDLLEKYQNVEFTSFLQDYIQHKLPI